MKKIEKAKAGKSFGMLSVKAGIDKNPKPTAADRIAGAKMKAAGKAKNGAKVAAKKVVAKKPIKKAQEGTKMVVDGKEYMEGALLPEALVTASRITDKDDKKKDGKGGRGGKGMGFLEGNKIGRQMSKSYYGKGPFARRTPGSNRPRRRFEEGGEVSKAKKGASVKKAVGKCKYGC